MDLSTAVRAWDDDGFVVLPGLLDAADLAPAWGELAHQFPTAEAFHTDPLGPAHERFCDEFGGIDDFPFASVELSLLAVHPRLVELAAALLRTDDLRTLSLEAWAKYTGAADYEQHHHRDFLSQTLLAPPDDLAFQTVEAFVYVVDVPTELGAPAYVPDRWAADVPHVPNWHPRGDDVGLDADHPTWVAQHGRPDLYEHEVSAPGPAGTVVAYRNGTVHRGTNLVAERGARFTLHVNFRPAAVEWQARHAWVRKANTPEWHAFVARATPDQLALFGIPRPGQPYWTPGTLARVAERYPTWDLGPWRAELV